MDTRLGIVAIIVEEEEAVARVNDLLHAFAPCVKGRMGLPCPERGVNLISVVVDAPADVFNTLTGKLGMIRGVNAKTLLHRV